MKNIIFLITLLTIFQHTNGQSPTDSITKSIVDEGKRLYRSEMASWYGTDLFMERYSATEKIGGYVSYTENNISRCVFVSTGDTKKAIGTISFDSTYNLETAIIDLNERDLTKIESDLFEIRQMALSIVQNDTMFKTYSNTNLNYIPLINDGEKKVYILTGPTKHGVVIIGNDYLLTFDNENNLLTKKQLHKNIIPINYDINPEEGKEVVGAIHSHLPETGDFITATDICTLMLYEKFAKWKQHTVISKKYMSLWNCQTDELAVVSMDVIEKINKDQEKRKKKEKKKEKKENAH